MAKKRGVIKKRGVSALNFVAWLTGALVSLSIGFAMIGGTLTLPFWLGGSTLAVIVGWVLIITTLISAVLAILEK